MDYFRNSMGTVGKGISATALDKKINASEKVLLEVTQARRSMSNRETFRTCSIKSMNALSGKLAARMTPELVKQCTEIFQKAFARAEQGSELSRSSNQLRAGETEDWYKAAKKGVTMSVKEVEQENGDSYLAPKTPGSGKKRKSEDDDQRVLLPKGLHQVLVKSAGVTSAAVDTA